MLKYLVKDYDHIYFRGRSAANLALALPPG